MLTVGEEQPEPLLDNAAHNEENPALSPNGRWLAYTSDETGEREIWIREFSTGANPKRVSRAGGFGAVWARDGRELFYQTYNDTMGVTIEETSALAVGSPVRLFSQTGPLAPLERNPPLVPYGLESVNFGPTYDLSPDGERFLMVRHEHNPYLVGEVIVVQNWLEELKRLVPVD